MATHSVFLTGKYHEQRSLVGYNPGVHKEFHTTEQLITAHSGVKETACNAGDLGSISGMGRSPGGRNGNPLQYFHLKNPMDRGALWATVHGVTKSWTQLSNEH